VVVVVVGHLGVTRTVVVVVTRVHVGVVGVVVVLGLMMMWGVVAVISAGRDSSRDVISCVYVHHILGGLKLKYLVRRKKNNTIFQEINEILGL
jgi:UPF0716 family protein affecting phage T7 exclusion